MSNNQEIENKSGFLNWIKNVFFPSKQVNSNKSAFREWIDSVVFAVVAVAVVRAVIHDGQEAKHGSRAIVKDSTATANG